VPADSIAADVVLILAMIVAMFEVQGFLFRQRFGKRKPDKKGRR